MPPPPPPVLAAARRFTPPPPPPSVAAYPEWAVASPTKTIVRAPVAAPEEPVAAQTGCPRPASGLRFKVFGIPVSLNLSFLVVAFVLGYQPGDSLSVLVTFIGLLTFSVLWHELGHALAMKLFGHDPEIQLLGIFGLPFPERRRRSRMGRCWRSQPPVRPRGSCWRGSLTR